MTKHFYDLPQGWFDFEREIERQLLTYETKVPNQFKKAHEEDAGYDILAERPAVVPAWGKDIVFTGLKVSIPKEFVGILKSRSGLSVKHDIEVGAGVIDSGYEGEIKVVLRNFSNTPYNVSAGDKIAQLIVFPIYTKVSMPVEKLDSSSKRGSEGFNSTGYSHG